jgi:hypothetical protein
MESWYHFDITHTCMEGLVKCGLLRTRTEVMEWLVPGREEAPTPPNGYVVSFMPFDERGSRFLTPDSSVDCCTTTR